MKPACALFVLLALAAPALAGETSPLNVNTATEADLMKLPGMNQARAVAILNYREANGELIQLEELKLIPQVLPIYGQIEDKLTVE